MGAQVCGHVSVARQGTVQSDAIKLAVIGGVGDVEREILRNQVDRS